MNGDTRNTASVLVADGKGILAADETPGTLTKRFDVLGIRSTEQSRSAYREMLFTAPDAASAISGVIMQDETIRQRSSTGAPFAQVLADRGIVPGIKVDNGAKPLALAPGETITEGLDGLRGRLEEYRGMGARFAKWRAVIHIADRLPSRACVSVNAHALARYAALCQEASLVPIVEPEVLMDGSHSIERCEEVTTMVLHAVFQALSEQRVSLESLLLKPNMVGSGNASPLPASVHEVATATLRCLLRTVPAAVPGIVFLSGGQSDQLATAHLNAINRLPGTKPWTLSFSYGRALQDAALETWHGRDENRKAAQEALSNRAKCNRAASLGRYTDEMEAISAGAGSPAQRHDVHED
jgi:fructose-bisphosphate aldolase class I